MSGLEVYNESGIVMFNSFAKNASKFASGTHVTTTGSLASPAGTRSTLHLSSPSSPFVAFRPQGSAVMCVYQVTNSGSDYYFYIMCNGAAAAQIDWWAFNFSPVSAVGGCGLEVYDTSGAITYSTGVQPLRVIPVGSQVSGRSYAMIPGGISGNRSWDAGANGNFSKYWQQSHFDGIQLVGSTQVGIANFIADRATTPVLNSPLATAMYGPQNFIVADVTNY